MRNLRDRAELALRLHRFDEASELLGLALTHFQPLEQGPRRGLDDHPFPFDAEWAMTLSVVALGEFRQGRLQGALKLFSVSHALLKKSDNRFYELYDALHYASALSEAGEPGRSRLMATRAFQLSWRYGGWPHRVRALALLVGGHKLEAFSSHLNPHTRR